VNQIGKKGGFLNKEGERKGGFKGEKREGKRGWFDCSNTCKFSTLWSPHNSDYDFIISGRIMNHERRRKKIKKVVKELSMNILIELLTTSNNKNVPHRPHLSNPTMGNYKNLKRGDVRIPVVVNNNAEEGLKILGCIFILKYSNSNYFLLLLCFKNLNL